MGKQTEIDVKAFMRKQQKIPMLDSRYIYITPDEYGAMKRSHIVTVYRQLDAGRIPGAFKDGRRWKIPVLRGEDPLAL